MDDLVERLRNELEIHKSFDNEFGETAGGLARDIALACDEIERLREALREILVASEVPEDCESVKYFQAAYCYHKMLKIVQKALNNDE